MHIKRNKNQHLPLQCNMATLVSPTKPLLPSFRAVTLSLCSPLKASSACSTVTPLSSQLFCFFLFLFLVLAVYHQVQWADTQKIRGATPPITTRIPSLSLLIFPSPQWSCALIALSSACWAFFCAISGPSFCTSFAAISWCLHP